MSRAPLHGRRERDAYYTPDALARACVSVLDIAPGSRVLEPHVGGGAFVRAVRTQQPTAHVTGCDINPGALGLAACDVDIDGDFLGLDGEYDFIVGNPPFRGFDLHLQHALTLAPRVAFLLRIAVMESKGRIGLWRELPLRKVWVLAERPSFTGKGTDSAAYGWFHFMRGWPGPAEVVPCWSWVGALQPALLSPRSSAAGEDSLQCSADRLGPATRTETGDSVRRGPALSGGSTRPV